MHSKFKKIVITCGNIAYKTIKIPIKWYWKICNIKTRGVRVMIINESKVVLVQHWYNSLWVMPGGGIKKYETPEQAALREVDEETGIQNIQLEYLLGIYSNIKEGKNDTVYCYVVQLNSLTKIKKKFNLEISDSKWFDINNLPDQVSYATRQRVLEYQHNERQEAIRPWS